eukprot:gene2628-2872_t
MDDVWLDGYRPRSLPMDYFSLPARPLDFAIHIAKFGQSHFFGSRHLSQLVSRASLVTLEQIVHTVHDLFSSSTTATTSNNHVVTEHLEAYFVEIYPVFNVLSSSLSSYPRHHFLIETILEGIIQAETLDEALTVYIRRLLDDAYQIASHSQVLTGWVKIFNEEKDLVQCWDVTKMREKRQQVLTILKAAVLNDGYEIVLDGHLCQEDRVLPLYPPSASSSSSSTSTASTGWVRIQRRYKLTYRQRSRGQVQRCFSRYPLESVTVGLFLSPEDADRCISVCTTHLQSSADSEGRVGEAKMVDARSSRSSEILVNYLQVIGGEVWRRWVAGDYLEASVRLLVLASILDAQAVTSMQEEVRTVLTSRAGYYYFIKEVVSTLEVVLSLFLTQCDTSSALRNYLSDLTLSTEEEKEVEKLSSLFVKVSQSVQEVRRLVLAFLQTAGHHTELFYLRGVIQTTLQGYMELSGTQTRTRLEAILVQLDGSNGVAVIPNLMAMRAAFNQRHVLLDYEETTASLRGTISVLAVNAAVEVLNSLVTWDLSSYAKSLEKMTSPPPPASYRLLTQYHRANDSLPKCLLDLLGFVQSIGQQTFPARTLPSTTASQLSWRVPPISKLFYSQQSRDHKARSKDATKNYNMDLANTMAFQEEALLYYTSLMDIAAYLNAYNFQRLPAIDRRKWMAFEDGYHDLPKVIAYETAHLRYMRSLHLLDVLHRGCLVSSMSPKQLPKTLTILSELLPYAAASTTLPHSLGSVGPCPKQREEEEEEEMVAAEVFYPLRHGLLRLVSKKQPHGLYRLRIAAFPLSLQQLLTGGVIGCDRLLAVLGREFCGSVFLRVWQLPPIFPAMPRPALGMKILLVGGITASTALRWAHSQPHTAEGDGSDGGSGRKSKAAEGSKLDRGKLDVAELVEEEIVYLVEHDRLEQVEEVRQHFAEEVVNALHYLYLDKRWKLLGLHVPLISAEERVAEHYQRSTDPSPAGMMSDYLPNTPSLHLTGAAVAAEGERRRLKKLVGRAGKVEVEAAVLMPCQETACTLEELGEIFQARGAKEEKGSAVKVTKSKSKDKGKTKKKKGLGIGMGMGMGSKSVEEDEGDDGSLAFSPRVRSPRSPRASASPPRSPRGSSSSPSRQPPPPGMQPQVDLSSSSDDEGDGKEREGVLAEEEVLADLTASFDATYSDSDRLCATSSVVQAIQRCQEKKEAQVYRYQPIRLTFHLVAKLKAGGVGGVGGVANNSFSVALGKWEGSGVSLGNPVDVARYLTSTVFFSYQAATSLYGLLGSRPVTAQAQALLYSATRAHALTQYYYNYRHKGHAVRDPQLALDYLAQYQYLRQAYHSFPRTLCYLYKHVGSALHSLAHLINTVVGLFSLSDLPSQVDPSSLALTMVREIDLTTKYLLTSPAVVHLRGGVCEGLRLLAQMAELLRVTTMPIKSAREGLLPYLLPPPKQSSASRGRMGWRREDDEEVGSMSWGGLLMVGGDDKRAQDDVLEDFQQQPSDSSASTAANRFMPAWLSRGSNPHRLPDALGDDDDGDDEGDDLEEALRPTGGGATAAGSSLLSPSQPQKKSSQTTAWLERNPFLKLVYCLAVSTLEDALEHLLRCAPGDGAEEVLRMLPCHASLFTVLGRSGEEVGGAQAVEAVAALVRRAQSTIHHLVLAVDTSCTSLGLVPLLSAAAPSPATSSASSDVLTEWGGLMRGALPSEEVQQHVAREIVTVATKGAVLAGPEEAQKVMQRIAPRGRRRFRQLGEDVQRAEQTVRLMQNQVKARTRARPAHISFLLPPEDLGEASSSSGREGVSLLPVDVLQTDDAAGGPREDQEESLPPRREWTDRLLSDEAPKNFLYIDRQPVNDDRDGGQAAVIVPNQLLGAKLAGTSSMLEALRAAGAVQPALETAAPGLATFRQLGEARGSGGFGSGVGSSFDHEVSPLGIWRR